MNEEKDLTIQILCKHLKMFNEEEQMEIIYLTCMKNKLFKEYIGNKNNRLRSKN